MSDTLRPYQDVETYGSDGENPYYDSNEQDGMPCNIPNDGIVMESGGVVEDSCSNYRESDDVRNSIAEGYF